MSKASILFPNFKWAFSTLGCPELTLQECCALAESYGLHSIEARTLEGTADLPTLFKDRFGSPSKLATLMSERSVSVDFLDTSLKLFGNDESSRSEFLEFIPWAEALGIKWLRVFDGGEVTEKLSSQAIDGALETLGWWSELRSQSGWTVDMAFETHDALVYGSARKQLFDQADKPISIIWDTHHTWKKAQEPVQDSWNQLKGQIVNVHVKDSISKPSARHPFTYVQLSEGEFPLNETLDLINGGNYRGNVSLEWERQWHPYLPPLETALSKAKELNWF